MPGEGMYQDGPGSALSLQQDVEGSCQPQRCLGEVRGSSRPSRPGSVRGDRSRSRRRPRPGTGHAGTAPTPRHECQEDSMQSAWKETIAGGTPQAERAEFEQLARDIMKMQLKNAKTASAHGVPHGVDRTLHAKTTLATDRAELRFRDDLPTDLSHGFAQPGRVYPTIVRFSNAAGIGQSDAAKDLRGVALRVQVSPEESHDLLMTN